MEKRKAAGKCICEGIDRIEIERFRYLWQKLEKYVEF